MAHGGTVWTPYRICRFVWKWGRQYIDWVEGEVGLSGQDFNRLNARQAYVRIYALMVRYVGSVTDLEEQLEERAKEWDISRMAQDREAEVPESVAADMRALMSMAGPAPRRKKA
jgi:hypothetical protein